MRQSWARPVASGMTLLETAISLALVGILSVAIGSSILIASHALPDGHGPADGAINAAAVAERMISEMRYATYFTERTSTSATFLVADRDGDQTPEVIRYALVNNADSANGGTLTRRYNSQEPQTILEDVTDFGITYEVETLTEETTEDEESSLLALGSYISPVGMSDFTVKEKDWIGAFFQPDLPKDATGWIFSGVDLYLRSAGTIDGRVMVEIQLATEGRKPSGEVLAQTVIREDALLATYTSVALNFSSVPNLDKTDGIVVVIRQLDGAEACRIWFCQGEDPGATFSQLETTDGGLTWTIMSNRGVVITVRGHIISPGETTSEDKYFVQGVGLSVAAGSDGEGVVQAGTDLLNTPETVSP